MVPERLTSSLTGAGAIVRKSVLLPTWTSQEPSLSCFLINRVSPFSGKENEGKMRKTRGRRAGGGEGGAEDELGEVNVGSWGERR